MTTVNVIASRWSGGWELWNEDNCLTQVEDLSRARTQIIDYLDTIDENTDHTTWEIIITPDTDSLNEFNKVYFPMGKSLTNLNLQKDCDDRNHRNRSEMQAMVGS